MLGALAGVLGSLMALEAIRAIVAASATATRAWSGALDVDSRAMRFETLRYAWDPDNPLSGRGSAKRGARHAGGLDRRGDRRHLNHSC